MSPKPKLPPVPSIGSFSSPADHVPVLLNEVIAALLSMESPPAPTERGSRTLVDGTFGRGGHSRHLLQRLSTSDQLLAIDRDPDAAHAANLLAAKDQRFAFMQARFSELGRVLSHRGIEHADGILLDLGVSSPQLDRADRLLGPAVGPLQDQGGGQAVVLGFEEHPLDQLVEHWMQLFRDAADLDEMVKFACGS